MLILKPQSFDGVRRRCLPKFYKALEPGTEDDRMKGALWALNVPVFGMSFLEFMQPSSHPHQPTAKYAISGITSEQLVGFYRLTIFRRTDARSRSRQTFVRLSTQ